MQLPFVLGLKIDRPSGYAVVPRTIIEAFRHITETNVCALIVSIISIAFLLTIKVNRFYYCVHVDIRKHGGGTRRLMKQ